MHFAKTYEYEDPVPAEITVYEDGTFMCKDGFGTCLYKWKVEDQVAYVAYPSTPDRWRNPYEYHRYFKMAIKSFINDLAERELLNSPDTSLD